MDFDQIDKAPEEKERGVTISIAHIEYETAKRHYAHIDCPGHADYIKNMITARRRWTARAGGERGRRPDAADPGAHPAGPPGARASMVVFLNKVDMVDDPELLELVDLEIRELLTKYDFPGDDTPIIKGSALKACRPPRPEA